MRNSIWATGTPIGFTGLTVVLPKRYLEKLVCVSNPVMMPSGKDTVRASGACRETRLGDYISLFKEGFFNHGLVIRTNDVSAGQDAQQF